MGARRRVSSTFSSATFEFAGEPAVVVQDATTPDVSAAEAASARRTQLRMGYGVIALAFFGNSWLAWLLPVSLLARSVCEKAKSQITKKSVSD